MKKATLIWIVFFSLLLGYGGYQAYGQFKLYKSTLFDTQLEPGSFRRF